LIFARFTSKRKRNEADDIQYTFFIVFNVFLLSGANLLFLFFSKTEKDLS